MKFINKLFLILFLQIFICNFCFSATTSTNSFTVSVGITGSPVVGEPGGGGTVPTPPVEPGIEISGTTETNITYQSADITVNLNKTATCVLEYGQDTNYGNQVLGQGSKTSHNFSLTNLKDQTKYYYKTTCNDASGSAMALGNFTTIIKPDTTPPQNVSGLTAIAGNGQVILSWVNPTDTDFDGVIIKRSDVFYPTSRTDGILVYDGKQETITDTGLINDKKYYYIVFSYDKIPNYSSGAITTATPIKPEEKKQEEVVPIVPPVVPPVIDIGAPTGAGETNTSSGLGPQSTSSKFLTKEQQDQVDKFDLKDISFSQNGKDIFTNDKNIIKADQPLDVGFDCATLPPFVKTAILNLSKDGKETSFILCADGKGNEMATMPPKENGKYALTILFLDYQNQVVKKIETEIEILPASFSKIPKKLPLYQQIFYVIGSIWILWWGKLLIVSLIVLTVIFIAVFRQREQIEIFKKFKRRKIEID
jgi:hypothetical protein